jgi:predicted RNA-binding Zn-ribbon protein involved in translation (DUF1610 family)
MEPAQPPLPQHRDDACFSDVYSEVHMSFERELGAQEAIERIVRMTKAFARHSDTDELEHAGGIVSYLAAHLEVVPDLMKGFWSVSQLPEGWHTQGKLTWNPTPGKPDSATTHELGDANIDADHAQHLMPCPFCGNADPVKTVVCRGTWTGTVECPACGAGVHGHDSPDFDAAIRSACDAWNRRIP